MENNKINNTNENYEKVLDLIQSIQTKMNQKENNENKDTKDSNVEIDNNKEVNNKNINLDNTNNTDFSAITDILKNVDIGNLINTFRIIIIITKMIQTHSTFQILIQNYLEEYKK